VRRSDEGFARLVFGPFRLTITLATFHKAIINNGDTTRSSLSRCPDLHALVDLQSAFRATGSVEGLAGP
ncbi:MAG: hypothetical protein Q8R42_05210, partial [Desulfocapsaceae bacterium]|nr:hypothetical protein [Desulfocapsaceae bacterium]